MDPRRSKSQTFLKISLTLSLTSCLQRYQAIETGCLCGCDEEGGGLSGLLQRTDPALPVVVELNGATDVSQLLNSGDPVFRMFNVTTATVVDVTSVPDQLTSRSRPSVEAKLCYAQVTIVANVAIVAIVTDVAK